MLLVFSLLGVLFAAGLWAQDSNLGTLSGIVISLANGSMLSHATVEVLPAGVTVEADLDGMFDIDLPPGSYDLKVTQKGFVPKVIKGVEVKAREESFQNIALNPENLEFEGVTVVAEAEEASDQALLAERKSAATVSEGIGSQEMARLAGSDAADVMQRVTGVTVVDDKFVYIRGLGERYSSTMLNGAILPSTQPDKKVVGMDLFPASLLENIKAEKSYTPDQPGEFSGGLVKVETIDFPRFPTLKLSYSSGFGTNTTFKDFLDYPGGDLDWLGFDDGTRSLPGSIPDERVVRGTRFSDVGFTPEELETFGESFSNVWSPRDDSAIPNQSISLVGGNTYGPLGLVFAFTHSNKFHNQPEERTIFKMGEGGSVTPFHDYDFDISRRTIRNGLTANLAYELADSQRILFRNFYSKDTSDEARIFEGFNGDANNNIRNLRLRFMEEGIYSGQVAGEHYVSQLGNSFLEWRINYSRSSLDEPDLREVLYEERAGTFVLADESQSGLRMFNFLDEDLIEPALDWTTYFSGNLNGSFKVGASYRSRDRDFSSRRFRFTPRDTDNIDLSLQPEQLYTPENIGPDGFELREETRPTDTYFAQEITRAAYGMVDLSIQNWRFVGGLRVEADSQLVETFDLFDRDSPSRITSRLDNTDALPSVNVIYRLRDDMNLRGSFSRTINRPEFRELSPFEFTDVVGGRSVVGNANLSRALIRNFDVRWEWFNSSADLFSISFFYKEFEDPIVRIIEPTSNLRTSFLNATNARNLGLEFDVRQELGLWWPSLSGFSVQSNYTFVDSEVDIPAQALNVVTALSRPLTGQSRHVFNGIFQYEMPGMGALARLLFNYRGSRITDVGSFGLPDIIQKGYPKLDAIFIQSLGEKWGLKFTAENLLNEEHKFTQGDKVHRIFEVGRVFSIGLSYSFYSE